MASSQFQASGNGVKKSFRKDKDSITAKHRAREDSSDLEEAGRSPRWAECLPTKGKMRRASAARLENLKAHPPKARTQKRGSAPQALPEIEVFQPVPQSIARHSREPSGLCLIATRLLQRVHQQARSLSSSDILVDGDRGENYRIIGQLIGQPHARDDSPRRQVPINDDSVAVYG
jgi:hypothetical protein